MTWSVRIRGYILIFFPWSFANVVSYARKRNLHFLSDYDSFVRKKCVSWILFRLGSVFHGHGYVQDNDMTDKKKNIRPCVITWQLLLDSVFYSLSHSRCTELVFPKDTLQADEPVLEMVFQRHLLQPEKFWNSWSTLHVTAPVVIPNWGCIFDYTTHNMSVFMSYSLTQLFTLWLQLWILSNNPLDKLDATTRLLVCCEIHAEWITCGSISCHVPSKLTQWMVQPE
jgi:hypothetical protein